MNYSEKYKQNLKNFNKYQRTRIDYDREENLKYLNLYFIEENFILTEKKEVELLIVELRKNIVQSMKDIISLKKILENGDLK